MTMLADPIVVSPSSIVAFYIVVSTALIVETGIVSALLAFRGAAPLNVFFGYLITNVSIYLLVFGLSFFVEPSFVLLKEIAVVLLDGLAIKILVSLSVFQGDNYRNVTWSLALLISGIGNSLSYIIGEIANHQHV
jgi:hypothetical protein